MLSSPEHPTRYCTRLRLLSSEVQLLGHVLWIVATFFLRFPHRTPRTSICNTCSELLNSWGTVQDTHRKRSPLLSSNGTEPRQRGHDEGFHFVSRNNRTEPRRSLDLSSPPIARTWCFGFQDNPWMNVIFTGIVWRDSAVAVLMKDICGDSVTTARTDPEQSKLKDLTGSLKNQNGNRWRCTGIETCFSNNKDDCYPK